MRHNVCQTLQGLPAETRLLAVVKAAGYGHGAAPVARAALEAGAWGLAVSTIEEAVALRGLVAAPDRILAMGGLAPADAAEAVAAGCAVICHSEAVAAALEAAAAAASSGRVPVHLKVDSGMNRLGCSPVEAPGLARRIAAGGHLRLAGVCTHFAASEADTTFTHEQFGRFQAVLGGLGVDPGLRHACNSAAALRHPEMALDAVRCGIALYGCEWPGLRPALSLRARVTQVKAVAAGAAVGYGRTWVAERASRIATIAIGYGDGVLRSRGGRGAVVIGGNRAPLVGRVSMDQVTADVTGLPGVEAGAAATLIGDGISAEEVAAWSSTISYEVLTALGPRIARSYKE